MNKCRWWRACHAACDAPPAFGGLPSLLGAAAPRPHLRTCTCGRHACPVRFYLCVYVIVQRSIPRASQRKAARTLFALLLQSVFELCELVHRDLLLWIQHLLNTLHFWHVMHQHALDA